MATLLYSLWVNPHSGYAFQFLPLPIMPITCDQPWPNVQNSHSPLELLLCPSSLSYSLSGVRFDLLLTVSFLVKVPENSSPCLSFIQGPISCKYMSIASQQARVKRSLGHEGWGRLGRCWNCVNQLLCLPVVCHGPVQSCDHCPAPVLCTPIYLWCISNATPMQLQYPPLHFCSVSNTTLMQHAPDFVRPWYQSFRLMGLCL